ncbi:MAG: transcriptional regulator [Candidatus Saccharimonadales bacterium]
MIDALFGSKTRVKLLHLFMNNPGKSFYVREITRLIDEQINSVRRELANMLKVGIIISDSADNKLYYEVNQRYEFYVPLRAIFSDQKMATLPEVSSDKSDWSKAVIALPHLRVAVAAGVLEKGSTSNVDLLLVGNLPVAKIKLAIKRIEEHEGREINYATMKYEEFYYRLSVRDKFITEIINSKHSVLVDTEHLLTSQK